MSHLPPKGQYATLPTNDQISSAPSSPQPSRLHTPVPVQAGYFSERDSDGSHTSMLRPSESRQQSPAPDTSSESYLTFSPKARATSYDYLRDANRHSRYSTAVSDDSTFGIPNALPAGTKGYGWTDKDIEADDALHTPDASRDAEADRRFDALSLRGWLNMGTILVLLGALVTLFAAYPIISFYTRPKLPNFGFNLGGVNSSGQLPDLPGMPSLIDPDTPDDAKTKTGMLDGKSYHLVFSDEFNTDGRSFYPGDDPYWEGVDLYYWATVDLEWYTPERMTTRDGKLEIELLEMENHNVNFQSGMLQSWNKFCFTTGIIEASISIAGDGVTPGLWPGFWTMGNLGRPGYGASTEGMWPYSYRECDVGTLPNQTFANNTPEAALEGGWQYGPQLSVLPGQRTSACTCPNTPSNEHPGPHPSIGRGVPEIDVIEAQIDTDRRQGQVSQSFQVAPFNNAYKFNNGTDIVPIYDEDVTFFNHYTGGATQQALSAVTEIGTANFGGNGYETYGFEWWSDPSKPLDGYISWFWGNKKTWTLNAEAMIPDPLTLVGQRLIPEEPMSIILNLGISPGFQPADFANLKFPYKMYIDWVRVYQRDGVDNVGCDPKAYPTSNYIATHPEAYTNPNFTTWSSAGYTFPGNSLKGEC